MAPIIEGAIVFRIIYTVIGGEAVDAGVINVDAFTLVLHRPPVGEPG
jgi:hypothetical protein